MLVCLTPTLLLGVNDVLVLMGAFFLRDIFQHAHSRALSPRPKAQMRSFRLDCSLCISLGFFLFFFCETDCLIVVGRLRCDASPPYFCCEIGAIRSLRNFIARVKKK